MQKIAEHAVLNVFVYDKLNRNILLQMCQLLILDTRS